MSLSFLDLTDIVSMLSSCKALNSATFSLPKSAVLRRSALGVFEMGNKAYEEEILLLENKVHPDVPPSRLFSIKIRQHRGMSHSCTITNHLVVRALL